MSDIPKQISVRPFDDTTVNGIPLIIHQTWKSNTRSTATEASVFTIIPFRRLGQQSIQELNMK
jgi:hypothetical protein